MIPKCRIYCYETQEMIVARDYRELAELFAGLDADDSLYSEPMQSTWLFGKNGKEIYEGDIVKFSDYDDDVYVTPVILDKNRSCFGISFSGKHPISFDYLEEFYTELKDIEVLGNIYENPELLEEL